MSLVSFVIPCYRSEKTLPAVIEEINVTMEKIEGYDEKWQLKTVWSVGYKFEVK